eukprot:scaffold8187_cov42-Cyclotella_meneghiniana.AAC.5
MESGSFLSVLSTNIVPTSGLDASIVNCLTVWGNIEDPKTEVHAEQGTGLYYPDWKYGSCLEDGKQPTYMDNYPETWISDSLDQCCASRGKTCGGLANVGTDKIYSTLRSCCESELGWLFVEFCEAEPFKSECYGGTGLYYCGDSVGVKNCVKDCDPQNGDRLCRGIVKEAWVVLHDTPEDCCTREYDWIDNDLCAARSTHSTLNKYWADKRNDKCEADSAECLSVSGMDMTGLGIYKYYVDFVNEQCSQDCEGPAPCGGLKKQWNILYGSEDECCEQLWWIAKRDCVKE